MMAATIGRALATSIRREFVVLRLAASNRYLPFAARVAALAGAAYAYGPIDIIPNSIPIIGLLDDVVVLLLTNVVIGMLAPARIMALIRAVARAEVPASETTPPLPGLYDCLGYRRRWRTLEAVARPYISERAPIVIGGCGRSGTTLVQTILGRHPAVYCGPESTVFLRRVSSTQEIGRRYGIAAARVECLQRQSRSQAEFVDLFAEMCLRRSGKSVWAEKTPENVRRLDFIWRHFPRARFIHVVRDGRDVVCSLRESPWVKIPKEERTVPRAVVPCARYWAERVEMGRRHRQDSRYFELRYEDLVRQPQATLVGLLDWLEVPWSGADLDAMILTADRLADDARDRHEGPVSRTSIGRWRRDLTSDERQIVEQVSGAMLSELGYTQRNVR